MAAIAGDLMQRHPMSRSLERSLWCSDLAAALGEAEKLLLLLEARDGFPEEAGRLRQRVRVLKSELTLLNRYILGEDRIVPGRWPEPACGTAEA